MVIFYFRSMPIASTNVRAGCPKLGHTTLVNVCLWLCFIISLTDRITKCQSLDRVRSLDKRLTIHLWKVIWFLGFGSVRIVEKLYLCIETYLAGNFKKSKKITFPSLWQQNIDNCWFKSPNNDLKKSFTTKNNTNNYVNVFLKLNIKYH